MNTPVNILLVDDDVRNLDVMAAVLSEPDYRLVRAQTADAALRALVMEEFAVLLLDVRMPDMSGLELAQLIKQRKKTQHVPIIFLTAYFQEDEHVIQGYDAGGVDYISKPCNPTILRSKVAVFVELFRKTRALEVEINERRRLEQRLIEKTDREQQRFGHELHDGICQILAALRIRADSLRRELRANSPAAAEAREIEQLLQTALNAGTGLSHALSPAVDEVRQLDLALQQLAQSLQKVYRIPFALDAPEPVAVEDKSVAMHLYKIAQEAAVNAAKHSGGDRIVLSLSGDTRQLQIRILDNGKGIALARTHEPAGMGLRIMQCRAHLIGARLELRPAPNGGTEVLCTLPMARQMEAKSSNAEITHTRQPSTRQKSLTLTRNSE